MRNHLACLSARKGATVAAAALVTLTLGLGTRALAEGIEVVPADGVAATSNDIAVVDGTQGEGQPTAAEPTAAKPCDGPQDSGIRTLSNDAQKNAQKVEYGERDSSASDCWYHDENGEDAEVPASEYADISKESFGDYGGFEFGSRFYVVTKDRTFKERPNVVGNARIVLCNGATVTFKKGIRCVSGKLTIYAQSTGDNMGRLIANGAGEGAGIGGGDGESNGSEIVICGGHVEATGAKYGAGIGGGDHGGCGTVRILGGTVKAKGGLYAAGIGSGGYGCCGKVFVSGGDVSADGGSSAAGIGGGRNATCDVTISGGKVKAFGNASVYYTGSSASNMHSESYEGAGIGTGHDADAGRVTISGGEVDASSVRGAGIGGGTDTSGGAITVTGGTIKATSRLGAGIGGGAGRDSGTITITGGHIEAQNIEKGVAIGHGSSGRNRDISLADHMTVRGMNGDRAKGADRVSVLNRWGHVWVEPCDHAGVDAGHCGFCKTYDGFRPAGATLDAAGPVGVTAWFEWPEEFPQKVGDVEVSYLNASGDAYRVEHPNLREARRDGSGRHGLFLATGPLGIADTVEVRFHTGAADAAFTYCLKDLAERGIEGAGSSGRELLEAMMSYGQNLQSWLSLVKGSETWGCYTTIQGEYGLDLEGARRGLEPFAGTSLVEGERHIDKTTCAVKFGSLAALDLYLTPAKGECFGPCEASMDGHAATCEVLRDGRLHVHVEDVAPADFDKPVIVAGLCGDARFEARASVLSYAACAMGAEVKEGASSLAKDQDAAMKRAMAAIYQYHVCARKYHARA